MTNPEQQPPSVLDVNGVRIEYTDRGDGPAMLLIHAGAFSEWFAPLSTNPTLDGFRLIRMIRGGYTSGPAPVGHLSFADHAAHCAALLDALGIAHADILGHSSGSAIALQLALDRPDVVDSLMLVEPPLLDPLAAPEDLDLLHASLGPVIGAAMGAVAGGDLPKAFDTFMRAVCGPEYRGVIEAALGADGMAQAENDCGFFFTDEIAAAGEWRFDHHRVDGIGQPVLLIAGGASPPPTHRLVAHLATMIPDAEVVTVDGENHLLPLRNPTALGRVISEFVARHQQGPRVLQG